MSRALRVALVGATGALGSEVLGLLDGHAELRVASLLPLASPRSQGESVSFQGETIAVRAEAELKGLDLVVCCAPPDASLAWVRQALRAEVPCVDASGALDAGHRTRDLARPGEPVLGCLAMGDEVVRRVEQA